MKVSHLKLWTEFPSAPTVPPSRNRRLQQCTEPWGYRGKTKRAPGHGDGRGGHGNLASLLLALHAKCNIVLGPTTMHATPASGGVGIARAKQRKQWSDLKRFPEAVALNGQRSASEGQLMQLDCICFPGCCREWRAFVRWGCLLFCDGHPWPWFLICRWVTIDGNGIVSLPLSTGLRCCKLLVP